MNPVYMRTTNNSTEILVMNSQILKSSHHPFKAKAESRKQSVVFVEYKPVSCTKFINSEEILMNSMGKAIR